jgi:hypothetical protein
MHTPGPWRAVAAEPECPFGFEIMAGDLYVAVAHGGIPVAEQAANANLVAAAPEMYAVLCGVLANAPDAAATARAVWLKASGMVP